MPEAVDDVEHDIDIETGPIHNWSSLLYEVWRLAFGMEIHRVVWQLDDFFADVDGPEEPEEEPEEQPEEEPEEPEEEEHGSAGR